MATELTDGVWRLDLGRVNAYLVDDDELLLFDAGTPGAADDLLTDVRDAGYDVVDVERVVITHYDVDHVGGLSALTPDLKAPVVAREPDASYVAGTDRPSLRSLKGITQRVAATAFRSSPPDLRIERVIDGEEIGSFTAYHTPGHTRGHMAYVSTDLDAAILGDLVREKGGRLRPSPWYLSLDSDAVADSIRKLASRAPEFDVACPGHGDPVREGDDELVRLASDD